MYTGIHHAVEKRWHGLIRGMGLMAIVERATGHDLAQALISFLRDRPIVDQVWMQEFAARVDFWLLTKPAAPDEVRELFAANFLLDEHFPSAHYSLRIVNPALFVIEEFRFEPPSGSVPLDLFA
jgi:hypothetical protein